MSNNIYLKILAIISAVFLWFFVINEGFRIDTLDTEIPIKIQNLSEDLMIANDLPQIKLTLRAPTDVWQQAEIASNIDATINLQYYNRGEYSVEVKVESKDKNIQIIKHSPSTVDVVLAPIISEDKTVELDATGNLAKDYQADKPTFSADKVQVQSAQSILDQVVKVVAPIQYNGETSEIKKTVELEARDKDNKKISKVNIIPKAIDVTIPVSKVNGEKTVGVRANTVGSAPAGTSVDKIELNPSTITIKGKTDKIKDIDTIDTKEIDLSNLTEDVNNLNVGLILTDGVEAKDNPTINVKIFLNQTTITKEFSGIIKYKNLADQFKVGGIMPSHISLTIQGPSAKINSLNEADVYAELDLAGKGAGTYDFNIFPENVTAPSGIAVRVVNSGTIKVVVVKK